MEEKQFVEAQWKEVSHKLNIPSVVSDTWWQIINRRYSEEWRFYHTLSHIAQMLKLFEQWKQCITEAETVCLAIFFHDIVYDPEAKNNEEQSAVLFEKFAQETTMAKDICDRVNELIMATVTHKIEKTGDNDLCLFLDIDLSILGQSPEVYESYSRNIRQEYIYMKDEDFRLGRIKVLQSLLSSPHLYYSKELKDVLELQAKENMQKEIHLLKSQV